MTRRSAGLFVSARAGDEVHRDRLPEGLMTSGKYSAATPAAVESEVNQWPHTEGYMVENIWLTSALWIGLALLASLLSIRIAISVALIEIVVGVVGGNLLGLTVNEWVNYLAGVGAIVLLIVGISPLEAYGRMISFSTDSTSFASMINKAIPLYVSAVAVAIGFQMNLFNIGVEGQYLIAAMFAGWVGTNVVLWGPLHIAVIILTAIVVGAIWAGIAGALKVTRGVNEVISTIMLNFIAFSAIAYLLANVFSVESTGLNLSTGTLPPSGRLPDLNFLITMFGFAEPRGIAIPGFLIFAILLGVGDRKSTRLNSSHIPLSRMPSSA